MTIKSNRVHYRTETKNTIWNLYRIDYRIVHKLDNKGLNTKINPFPTLTSNQSNFGRLLSKFV